MTSLTVYVPRDAAARSVGADAVADALVAEATARGSDLRVVRNGSRGMLWLEPLVEVATPAGRVAFGPVGPTDVPGILDACFGEAAAAVATSDTRPAPETSAGPETSAVGPERSAVGPEGSVAQTRQPLAGLAGGADHPLCLGPTDEIPWLARQQRLIFPRVGVIDPLSTDDYLAHGGLAGLTRALSMDADAIVAEVTESGLRGRGGAGFPAGIKWRTVLDAPGPLKFVCCNADEGDSGTFADRMLMEGDPFLLIEGMVITARAVGAREGFVYVRSEYPDAIATMRAAIEAAYAQGWLGKHILGSDTSFDLDIRVGAGAYICGEETAMLESLEGRRGQIRAKPPLPALEGLFGKPTVVNNVLSLASVPWILANTGAAYQALGTGRSRGTQVFQLAGNIRQGGIVETAFGITLGELVEDFGGGTRSGRPVRAVQVGGPLGAYLPADQLDLPMDYEAFAQAGAMVGHGGIVVFDDTVDMARQARFAMEFCVAESCGKCTPCRVGAVRGVEVIDRIIAGTDRDANLTLLEDLCEVMTDGSLCAMGGLTPMPVRSALLHFGEDFERPVTADTTTPGE